MSILIWRLRESLIYLIESHFDDDDWARKHIPANGVTLEELFCQLFDDTGLSDSIERGTTEKELGVAASDSLLKLSDAVDAWDYKVDHVEPDDMKRFRHLARIALRAIEQRDEGSGH